MRGTMMGADASLAPVLAVGQEELKTVRYLIVYGDRYRSELPEPIDHAELLAAQRPGYPWPEIEETAAGAIPGPRRSDSLRRT
jgi:hypothetical protein